MEHMQDNKNNLIYMPIKHCTFHIKINKNKDNENNLTHMPIKYGICVLHKNYRQKLSVVRISATSKLILDTSTLS
jgi:hypothetical protein